MHTCKHASNQRLAWLGFGVWRRSSVISRTDPSLPSGLGTADKRPSSASSMSKTSLIIDLRRSHMHNMNYATSAPAATAGGQQHGPVSERFVPSLSRRLDSFFSRNCSGEFVLSLADPIGLSPCFPAPLLTSVNSTARLPKLRYQHHSVMAPR